MVRTKKPSQLELFKNQTGMSVEERLRLLEKEIKRALKKGELERAEALIEEQHALLEIQMTADHR